MSGVVANSPSANNSELDSMTSKAVATDGDGVKVDQLDYHKPLDKTDNLLEMVLVGLGNHLKLKPN